MTSATPPSLRPTTFDNIRGSANAYAVTIGSPETQDPGPIVRFNEEYPDNGEVTVVAGETWPETTRTTGAFGSATTPTAIAPGIGPHNLGEGLAVGAAIASDFPSARRLVGLVLLAGMPAIVCVWIDGFSHSPLMAVLSFAVGAGAILQVIVEMSPLLYDKAGTLETVVTPWVNLGGVTAGLAVMCATASLV